MNDLNDLFWNASLTEMKQGYVEAPDTYTCILCGTQVEKGIIYPHNDQLYEAEKYMRLHITQKHESMFHALLNLDKNASGLTDLQKKILHFLYQGLTDAQIVNEMDGGSKSTIRNHRFTLREKKKQAKILVAIMELLDEKNEHPEPFVQIHTSAKMVDERYAITEKENEEILRSYFTEGLDGGITTFPKKEKRKVAILRHITQRFTVNQDYTEKEVNEILRDVFHDYVTLRRYLIEYGFLDRTDDGRRYWVKR